MSGMDSAKSKKLELLLRKFFFIHTICSSQVQVLEKVSVRDQRSPLGPRIRTVSCPAPAPRVSTTKRLWKVARIPFSTPGPLTRTLLASGCAETLNANGLPAMQTSLF